MVYLDGTLSYSSALLPLLPLGHCYSSLCLATYLGPVIFHFKKSQIPFRFRFIIGNVEFDEITIYRKKVRWTDRQNGTISAVN